MLRHGGGVTVAGLVAVASALAAARAPRVDLAQVMGHTVCPLAVVVDEDPLRLPRRIKFMECARAPAAACAAAPALCCARRDARGALAHCVEVLDNVVVQFLAAPGADPRNATRSVIQVPVGCACVVQPATAALEDD